MIDGFLNTLLQIVIAIDVIGVIAYFVLGALNSHRKEQNDRLPVHRPSLWHRLFRQPQVATATEGDFEQFRRVLYSYQEGII